MKYIVSFFSASALVAAIALSVSGQDKEIGNTQVSSSKAEIYRADSLKNILHGGGKFEGRVRNFFMSTINQSNYPDYYAFATGVGLGYYSPTIKRFQVGLSGFVIYNFASSQLGPQSPFGNRYEIGLFDITNPENHNAMSRLEDLYLRYYLTKSSKSFLQIGKFYLRTPLINLQDGRMRPNLQEGLWAEWNDSKKIKLKGGWLWRTSPRSTTQWYDIGQSLVYPNGRALNGAKATYSNYTRSNFILVGNISFKPVNGLDVQVWDYYADQLFNMSFNKMEYKRKAGVYSLMAGVQYAWQQSAYRDTLAVEKQYIAPNAQSHTFSSRVSISKPKSGKEWSINYTRITRHGRYLFPREWGIEPFYTFMQRERNEGAGDVHAAMLQHTRFVDKNKQLELMLAGGPYWMPPLADVELNKYAMPSYYQFNARMRYKFQNFLKGLQGEVLYTYKANMNKSLEPTPATFHNKVDMHHLSVMLDYSF